MKVSIIVPIYNSEKYLEECILSICNQSYKDIEIILVDDGSTDESLNICNKFKESDSRIVVLSQQNKGVSTARNYGLEVATGVYIKFVDSDDMIDKFLIESLVDSFNDVDLICTGYKELYVNKQIEVNSINEKLSNYDCIMQLFISDFYGGFIWNKMYKKKIIDINKLKFNINTNMCEDLIFNIEYLLHIDKVKCIENTSYYYRMRKNSISRGDSSRVESLLISYKEIYNELCENFLNLSYFNYYFICLFYKEKNRDNKEIYSIYKNVMIDKNISLKRKFKVFLLRNCKFVYDFYLKVKFSKNILFR